MNNKLNTAVIVSMLNLMLVTTGAFANPQTDKTAQPAATHAQHVRVVTPVQDDPPGVDPAYYQTDENPFHQD